MVVGRSSGVGIFRDVIFRNMDVDTVVFRRRDAVRGIRAVQLDIVPVRPVDADPRSAAGDKAGAGSVEAVAPPTSLVGVDRDEFSRHDLVVGDLRPRNPECGTVAETLSIHPATPGGANQRDYGDEREAARLGDHISSVSDAVYQQSDDQRVNGDLDPGGHGCGAEPGDPDPSPRSEGSVY